MGGRHCTGAERRPRSASRLTAALLSLLLCANCRTVPERSLHRAKIAGHWGPVIQLPTHPEQMVTLPSGKVLMWPWAPGRREPRHGPVVLWNPVDGSSLVYGHTGLESASGLAFQPNGVLLSAGGDKPRGGVDGSPRAFTFDYRTERLTEVASMARGRISPGATTLASGDILVTGGLDEESHVNAVPELWDGREWTPLPAARNDESGLGTFQFLAPDGRLFRAGPEPLTDWLDVTTGEWTDVEPAARNQVRYHGTAVMYDDGRILLAGGCPVGPEAGWSEQCRDTALSTAEVIDLRDSSPTWRPVGTMARSRHSHHATLLPDGTVLITGGTDRPGIFHDEDAGILEAELWDPQAENFVPVAAMSAPHHFQSTAVLLPDATVLVAGGRFGPGGDDVRFAWSGQVYYPAYLERGPRPVLTDLPGAVRYGAEFRVASPQAERIASVVLMGLSTSRIGWNSNQRRVLLDFELTNRGLLVAGPDDPNLAPPGFYLLFGLSDGGTPSVGRVIRIEPG